MRVLVVADAARATAPAALNPLGLGGLSEGSLEAGTLNEEWGWSWGSESQIAAGVVEGDHLPNEGSEIGNVPVAVPMRVCASVWESSLAIVAAFVVAVTAL